MEKRYTIYLVLIAVATILSGIVGASYAFYSFNTDATDTKIPPISGKTDTITGINLVGDSVASTSDAYPGWKGIQKFAIKLPDNTPKDAIGGKYTVVLTPNIDTVFGSDIKYTVYKTTDTSNTITRAAGTLVNANGKLSRTDTITFGGTWASSHSHLATGVFSGTQAVRLTPETFNGNFQTTYYYVVYEYTNNDSVDQSGSMGHTFTVKVSLEMDMSRSE